MANDGLRNFNSHDKCDIHFVVEKSINDNSARLDQIESKSTKSYEELKTSLNEFIIEVRSLMNAQQYKDKEYNDIRQLTRSNTEDIQDIKSSMKITANHHEQMHDSIQKINKNIENLGSSVKQLEKTVLDKDDVSGIVQNVIDREKNATTSKWFDSLPAKLSAGAALASLIIYLIGKIVILMMAAMP